MKYLRKITVLFLLSVMTSSLITPSVKASTNVLIATVAGVLIGWKLYCVYNNACVDQLEIDNRRITIWRELTEQKNIPEHNARELIRHLDEHASTIRKMNYLYGHYAAAWNDLPDHSYAMSAVTIVMEEAQRQDQERSWWHYVQSFYKK